MQQETSKANPVDTQALVERLSRTIVHAPSSPLVPIIASLERMAQSRANVLVIGESGVGKEAIVRALHDLAPWHGGPFQEDVDAGDYFLAPAFGDAAKLVDVDGLGGGFGGRRRGRWTRPRRRPP